MDEKDVISVCKEVLSRLSKMGYEKDNVESVGQLIFPVKNGGDLRISEQELRQLFIDVYKEAHPYSFYSIETPTQAQFKFGKVFTDISADEGRSASLDMCIYKKNEDNSFERELNIEFKFGNVSLFKIGKDILKLMREKQNGAFIILLKNTDSGSLCNKGGTGVLDKLNQSFTRFYDTENNSKWNENDEKHIQLIILSLEEKTNTKGPAVLIHRTLVMKSIKDLKTFFSINAYGKGNISTVNKDSGWCAQSVNEIKECK